MFLHFFTKKIKASAKIQEEYIDSIIYILESPLWDKSDKQIYLSLPGDLTQETIEFAKKKWAKKN